MAASVSFHGGHIPSKFYFQPAANILNRQNRSTRRPAPPPIFISSNPSHVNTVHLRDLYAVCNYSCYRFPNLQPDGRVEPVDIKKLGIALSHSSVVVSVFTKPEYIPPSPPSPEMLDSQGIGGEWIQRVIPVTPFNGELVGFGRAISDFALTASIYDVMVIPALRRRGIGRMIIQRIIRLLTNKGIYDIAALCSDVEREFFKACGFGDDVLGSTTMMYTRSGSSSLNSNQMVKSSGRKLLLVPPPREPFQS